MESMLDTVKSCGLPRYGPVSHSSTREPDIPLAALKAGDRGTVSRMEGGEEFRCKMLALGIIPGKVITVARGDKHQPFILRIDESRIMIDWKALSHIYVRSAR